MIFEWTALNDEFTVSAAGTMALPFISEIPAAGVAPGDLANAIGHQLKTQMGLGQEPHVSVEVVQFRPFYVVGQVTQPGEFPYRPELTVLKALSLAGGLRLKDDDLLRLPREVIAARGELGIYDLQAGSLLVRKARLESELGGRKTLHFQSS
jgi:polysaccharide export outer membrane protein/exopolysaccharide production protein ExoF